MKPLVLQWCPPVSGHFTNKLSLREPERVYLSAQNIHSSEHHIKKLLECGVIYNSNRKLNRGHCRILLSQHSSLPFFTQQGRYLNHALLCSVFWGRKVESNLALSASACPVCFLKQNHANASLRNKQLELHLCHSKGGSRFSNFSLEFSRDQWKRSTRDICSFRVHAESENSNRSWWKQFLFDPIDTENFPIPLSDVDDEGGAVDESNESSEEFANSESEEEDWCKDDIDRMLADDASFTAWQQRIKARTELRVSQVRGRDPDSDNWEDWLEDSWGDYSSYFGGKDSGWYSPPSDWEKGGLPRSPPKLPERGMSRTMKELLFRIFEDEEEVKEDLAFEDRVFRFTSQTTVKFVAVLIFVPWLVANVSHDFLIVPFLNRYVETVPLAAELLDLRESQKLNMVETLKMERQRVRFEAALGKAPPLSDEELLEHIREEALELRDELRLENRKAFGNIWSDLLAGLTIFLLLVFNPERVAIMRLTGNRLFTNISDTGKAFLIILLSDIFLGYHSESGWETVVEIFLDHYGFEVDKASIYIFVAIVPVTIDACFKLWVFRNLTRLSPSAAATFKEMKRH